MHSATPKFHRLAFQSRHGQQTLVVGQQDGVVGQRAGGNDRVGDFPVVLAAQADGGFAHGGIDLDAMQGSQQPAQFASISGAMPGQDRISISLMTEQA